MRYLGCQFQEKYSNTGRHVDSFHKTFPNAAHANSHSVLLSHSLAFQSVFNPLHTTSIKLRKINSMPTHGRDAAEDARCA